MNEPQPLPPPQPLKCQYGWIPLDWAAVRKHGLCTAEEARLRRLLPRLEDRCRPLSV